MTVYCHAIHVTIIGDFRISHLIPISVNIIEKANQPQMVDQTDDDLKRSAGEILNGVKRTVEVQVVDSTNPYNFQDQTILGKISVDKNRLWFCFGQ